MDLIKQCYEAGNGLYSIIAVIERTEEADRSVGVAEDKIVGSLIPQATPTFVDLHYSAGTVGNLTFPGNYVEDLPRTFSDCHGPITTVHLRHIEARR